MPKVFISYSHDSKEHRDFVRGISDRMRLEDGLDCQIDQYIIGSPPEGWQRWMENQIEQADFVLLVCTPNYLKRYRGEEREGGRGVTFEGVVISQTLYDHYYRNTKFIPVIPENGSLDHVPLPLKGYSCYFLPADYDKLYRVLTGQAEYMAPPLGQIRLMPVANAETPNRIHSDRLPTVKGKFFGREAELELLNEAWAGNGTRIIQFIAPGGTGKTKLLRHWLDHTNDDIDALIAWSFYSQGSSEDKQVSASPFFSHAFEKLGSTRTTFATEEDRGEHLADLLRQQRCVLVLDGLEPLQHASKGMRGELKDRAIRQLLRSLARQNKGLCIITTRIAVHELSDRAHVIAHNLQNLAPGDGVKLLQSLGVNGNDKELEKTVREYGCHALALSLLGNVLRLRHKGDVLKRDTLKDLVKPDGNQVSRHAFKVMQAYEEWFAGEPELALLHLLGLFDHPIGQEVLQVLWDEQIPNLTAGISEDDWLEVITTLREEHHLLSQYEGVGGKQNDQLDCHPLIREYFSQQLRENQSDAWRQAHIRLYEYYKGLPQKLYGKELPDTLEEMRPLFSAVAHGCAAELHQRVLGEVYWPRIQHEEEYFMYKKLGGFSDDLAALAHFFKTQWKTLTPNVTDQARILSCTGFNLRSQGRLNDALEPMKTALKYRIEQKEWKYAAINASNLSELQLTLGNVVKAINNGQLSVMYADFSQELNERVSVRTTHADALHQNGELERALELFLEAEVLQKTHNSTSLYLQALWGFRYNDLLLAQGASEEVLKRAEYALEISQRNNMLQDISLNQLTLGYAHLRQGNFTKAAPYLDQAIDSLRAAGTQHHLPRGLLVRAVLYRDTRNPNHDFTRAHQDLQEVFDIAEPSGMRLYLTDYHLEMARLLIAEKGNPPQSPFFKGGSQGSDVVVIPSLEKVGSGGNGTYLSFFG